MLNRRSALAAATLLAALATPALTRAAIIPLLSGSPVADGPNFDWVYNASIGSDFRVEPGDFFTLYDFGKILGHSEPAGWTFSTSLTGANPFLVTPDDDAGILNITYTYTGATTLFGPNLGNFVLTINSNAANPLFNFGAEATRNGGDQDGRFGTDYGVTVGPASPAAGPDTPEPASLLAACGLVAPFALRRRRA